MRRSAALASVLVWAAVLALLAVLPYSGALRYPLLRDDRTLLESSWLANDASATNVFRHHYWHGTRHDQSDLYRPLTVLSLTWNLRWASGRAGLRGVNFALHALAALAVWWSLARLFRGSGEFAGRDVKAWYPPIPAAWAAAALFAAHPFASEAVLFVTGRAEILAAACGLTALGVLIGPMERAPDSVRLLVATALFALALGCKESAVSLIPILLAYWLTQRLAGREVRRVPRAVVLWSAVTATFLLLRAGVVGFGVRRAAVGRQPAGARGPCDAGGERGAHLGALHRHDGAAHPLERGIRIRSDPRRFAPSLGARGALAVVAVWTAVAVRLHRLSPTASFLWAFVPAGFAVTSNAAFPIGTIFAERLAYLPLAGLCGLGGYLSWRLPLRERTRWLILLVVVLLGTGRTWDRADDYHDQATFDAAAATASPRSVGVRTWGARACAPGRRRWRSTCSSGRSPSGRTTRAC